MQSKATFHAQISPSSYPLPSYSNKYQFNLPTPSTTPPPLLHIFLPTTSSKLPNIYNLHTYITYRERDREMENQMQVQPTYPTMAYNHHLQQQQPPQNLQNIWTQQRSDMDTANDFKNHQLPLARIKKIMKADEDVKMISAEAPVLFAKACELFILELTVRSWMHAEENKRRTLQKNDIAAAITRTDIFDFLVDIVPGEEIKAETSTAGGGAGGGAGARQSAAVGVPYYYSPAAAVDPGIMMGTPAMEAAAMFVQRGMVGQGGIPAEGGWQQTWQHGGLVDDELYGHGY